MITVTKKMIKAGIKEYLKDRPRNEQQFHEMMTRIYRAMETKRQKEQAMSRYHKEQVMH